MAEEKKYNIRLTALDETRAAFDSARRNVDDMQAPVESLKLLMGSLGAISMLDFAKSGIEAVDRLHDLAIKANTSVESLSAMRLAAAQTGVSIDDVATSIGKLSKSIGEARVTGGEKESLFKTLGIDISAGRDAGEIMLDLAKKLSAMSDKEAASYVSSQLLGKSYAELKPFMERITEQGTLVAEATTKQAEEANKLNDRWVALMHSLSLFAENPNVVNRLNDIWDAIDHTNRSSGVLQATLTGLRGLMDVVFGQPSSEIGKSEQAVGLLFNRIAQLKKNLDDYNNTNALGKFFDGANYAKRMQDELDQANAALKAAIDKRDDLYKQQNNEQAPAAKGEDVSGAVIAAKKAAEANKIAEDSFKKLVETSKSLDAEMEGSQMDAFTKTVQRYINVQDELFAVGARGNAQRHANESAFWKMVDDHNVKLAADEEKLAAVKAAHLAAELVKENEYFAKIGAMARQFDKSAEASDQQRFEDQIIEFQKRYEAFEKLDIQDKEIRLSEEKKFQDALARIIAAAEEDKYQTGKARNIQQLAEAGTQFRAMFELNKVVRTADAVIDGYAAVQKAYAWGAEVGGPWGAAAAAAVAFAATAANVMAINNAQFGGGTGMSGAGGGGGGAPLTTPSPIAPAPTSPTQNQSPPVTIHVYITGNVLSSDFVENTVIPQLKNQIANSDVLIIDPRSRQAQVLANA